MINNLLTWFDGRKTTIGAILLFIATFISEVIVGKWHLESVYVQPSVETLNWLGMALTGLGLGHKGVKIMKTKPEETTNPE